MQNIYETFEFHAIKEHLLEYAKTELAKVYITELVMFDNPNDVKNALEDLKEISSIIIRFGPLPIGNSANALVLIDLAKKPGERATGCHQEGAGDLLGHVPKGGGAGNAGPGILSAAAHLCHRAGSIYQVRGVCQARRAVPYWNDRGGRHLLLSQPGGEDDAGLRREAP